MICHGSVCSEMGQKHRNVGSRKASTTDGSPILISSCLNGQWSSNQARTRYDKFCRIYLFESPASQQEKCETVRNLTEMKRYSRIQRSLMFILILTSVILTTITLSSVESFHLWICIATSFSNYQWEGKHLCLFFARHNPGLHAQSNGQVERVEGSLVLHDELPSAVCEVL